MEARVGIGRIYTSTDSGVTWTPRESDRAWRAVACSADGTKLVAAVWGGRIYTSTTTTRVGTAGGLQAGADAAIELLYVGNGRWRVVSSVGGITSF